MYTDCNYTHSPSFSQSFIVVWLDRYTTASGTSTMDTTDETSWTVHSTEVSLFRRLINYTPGGRKYGPRNNSRYSYKVGTLRSVPINGGCRVPSLRFHATVYMDNVDASPLQLAEYNMLFHLLYLLVQLYIGRRVAWINTASLPWRQHLWVQQMPPFFCRGWKFCSGVSLAPWGL